MRPVDLTGLGIEGMQKTAEVCLVHYAVFNCGSRDGTPYLIVMPDQSSFSDVTAFGGVDAVHVSDAFAVFRVLTVGDVDLVFIDHRRTDQLVTSLGPN